MAWGLTNLHTSQAQASRAVTTYKQWQKAYVAGKSQKYVKANNGQGATTAFSEGQGYGMLAAVLAPKRVPIHGQHLISCTSTIVLTGFQAVCR
ncbi:glycosyl hydrolase family 8 [Levilactobacillus brevis]|nr:glycosyl hydrolase family 8 [Levilactobacillus brevis]